LQASSDSPKPEGSSEAERSFDDCDDSTAFSHDPGSSKVVGHNVLFASLVCISSKSRGAKFGALAKGIPDGYELCIIDSLRYNTHESSGPLVWDDIRVNYFLVESEDPTALRRGSEPVYIPVWEKASMV
jgi:hypothetical protein